MLVNNAGIMPVGPFVAETDESARRLVDINVHGVILGSKLAIERFTPRRRGHIVQLASIAGKGGYPGGVTYCATKHAVVGLTEALRSELRGSGIEMHQVLPIGVNTELYSGVSQARGFTTPEPEDVANTIVELLQTGRFELYVPRAVGVLTRLQSLMPRRLSEAIVRMDQGRSGAARRRPGRARGLRGAHQRRAVAAPTEQERTRRLTRGCAEKTGDIRRVSRAGSD